MPDITTNLGLLKPLPEEFYSVDVQNENMDKIDAELAKKYDIAIVGANIPEGADLNDYMTVGVYRSANNAISATLKNSPYMDAGFKLVVEIGYGSNHRIQTAYCGTVNRRLTRTFADNAWSQWSEFASTADTVKKSGDTMTGNLHVSRSNKRSTLGINETHDRPIAFIQYLNQDKQVAANLALNDDEIYYQPTKDMTNWIKYKIIHEGNIKDYVTSTSLVSATVEPKGV